MKKWISSMLLWAGILLAMLPVRASAAAATTITIGGQPLTDGYYAQNLSATADASNYALHFASGTLTLRDASINSDFSTDGDLTLLLEGQSSISGKVLINGNLTIEGNGSLTVNGVNVWTPNAETHALQATGDITVKSGTVNAIGGYTSHWSYTRSYAVYATNIYIENGKVTVTAGSGYGANSNSFGFYANNDIVITGGETVCNLSGCGGGNGIAACFYANNTMSVTNAFVTASGSANSDKPDLMHYGIYALNGLTVTDSTLSASCGDSRLSRMRGYAIFTKGDVRLESSAVTAKAGFTSAIDAYGYGVYSTNLTIIDGSFLAEAGGSDGAIHRATSTTPIVKMDNTPYYQWTVGDGYQFSLNAPYSSSQYNPMATSYFCIKPMEAAVMPLFRINATTGEWEVSHNEGYDWQSLGLKAAGVDATDGKTPYIGTNGNWWFDGQDMGVSAAGATGQDGSDGSDGKDGSNGRDGIDGQDGKDGKNGVDGKDGTNGQNGLNGTDGKDGVNGKDGVDGKDGANGKDGTDGRNGTDGTDGKDGRTPYIGANGNWCIGDTDTGIPAAGKRGESGSDGKDGVDGSDGTDGRDGVDGQDGSDGTDGRDISAARIDEDGCLILTMSDGTERNVGRVYTDDAELSGLESQAAVSTIAAGVSFGGLLVSLICQFLKRKHI